MYKLLIIVLISLNACGVKGELYLPPEDDASISLQSLDCRFCVRSGWTNNIISL